MTRRLAVLLLVLASAEARAQSMKISDMPAGTPAQSADVFPVARSGANYKIPISDLCRVANCTMTAPILLPDGTAANPSIGFVSAPTAGLYFPSSYYLTLKSVSYTGTDQLGGATQIYPGNGTGTAGGGSVYIGACPAVGVSGTGVGGCVNNAIFHSSGMIILGNVTVPTGNGGLSQWYGANAAAGQTDKNGGGIAMRGGQSTGTGTGGGWSFDIAPPAATTGTALNGFQTAISVNGGTGGINVGNILISAGVPTQHNVVGNRSGAANTVGGAVAVTGGAATNGNANGGEVLLDGGAGIGTGIKGYVRFVSRTFASLGTPSNGSLAYCSDCTIANPCAGAGTGAIAKRLNAVWVCN